MSSASLPESLETIELFKRTQVAGAKEVRRAQRLPTKGDVNIWGGVVVTLGSHAEGVNRTLLNITHPQVLFKRLPEVGGRAFPVSIYDLGKNPRS